MLLNIVFIGADAGGNVPPVMAVARRLAARGHRITLAGLAPVDGFDHVPIPALTGRDPRLATSNTAQLAGMARMGMSPAVGRQTRELIADRRPDAVVIDGIMITAIRGAVCSGAPVAVLFHSFGALWGGRMSRGPASLLLGPLGLSPITVWRSADARLLLTDRVLDPLTDAQNTAGFEWTGTTEHGTAPEQQDPSDPPVVLVSLSTVWQNGQDDVYRRVIAALGELPVDVIVTRSNPDTPFTGRLPSNVEMFGRVSHAGILPRASLVVGHGGHSTTLAALAHGVPMLVLPLNTASDQPMIGRIVQHNGLGRTLPRTASSAELRDAARGILADPAMAANAARTGERLRAENGAEVAADRIEQLAAARS